MPKIDRRRSRQTFPDRNTKKVLFLHGLKSTPNGTKANWLRRYYEVIAPALDTSSIEAARRDAIQALDNGGSDAHLLIGSSFGGALAMHLVADGLWEKPVVLLSPAVAYAPDGFAPSARVAVVHGRRDVVVKWPTVSSYFANAGPGLQLFLGGWEHRLLDALDDGSIRRAIHWALNLHALARPEKTRLRELQQAAREAEDAWMPEPAHVARFVATVRSFLEHAAVGPLRTLALAIEQGKGLTEETWIEGATVPQFHELCSVLGWQFVKSQVQPRGTLLYDRIDVKAGDGSDALVRLHAVFPPVE